MCGIGGVLSIAEPLKAADLEAMRCALRHRGPDGSGVWSEGNLGLVHTRLAIIDLTASGAQPMTHESRGLTIVFNGEIYNYRQLKASLEAAGDHFHGSSDTEVILRGIARHGLPFVQLLEGMFAFAIAAERKLILVRDRLGMKPLFIATQHGRVLFASEPKALLAAGVSARIRPQGLLEYLALDNSQGLGSIYECITQLAPATITTIDQTGQIRSERYWSLPGDVREAGSSDRWMATFENVFSSAVQRHLVSDVPIGVFLSGGIDSTLVASFAASHGARLEAFSLGFPEIDDAPYAAFIDRLSTMFSFPHERLILDADSAMDNLLALSEVLDEPMADAADVGLFALSRAAGRRVKVVLTGDGGDEVFAGYRRHRVEQAFQRWRYLVKPLALLLPFLNETMRRRISLALKSDQAERYTALLCALPDPNNTVPPLIHPDLRDQTRFRDIVATVRDAVGGRRGLSSILAVDMRLTLHDTYLRKVDRSLMAAGLEGRVPFLDREIVELAARMPQRMLIHRGDGKVICRSLLNKRVKDTMTGAPKVGFTIPIERWLMTTRFLDMRHHFATPHSAIAGLVSDQARRALIAPTRSGPHAALQWKLLKLGLWSERWISTSRRPNAYTL